jgi:hypothetical protein
MSKTFTSPNGETKKQSKGRHDKESKKEGAHLQKESSSKKGQKECQLQK